MKKYKKHKHKLYYLIIILLILCIGIGYAVLNETLTISNGIVLNEMKWDVGFSKIEDNSGDVKAEAEISNDGKTITVYCDFGVNRTQQTCTVKATITNNSTFDIGLAADPKIEYDDTYIHTVTYKWNNHITYEYRTVLKDNYIKRGESQETILTIKSKFLDVEELPTQETVIPITITLNFEEWQQNSFPSRETLAVLKKTTSRDTTAFRSTTYISKIKNIIFENKINIPNDAIASWDIGVSQNGNVMSYVIANSNDSTYYDLYIQSNTQLYGNADMSYWFANFTKLESIKGLELLDTSATTNMYRLFSTSGKDSEKLKIDINCLDTSEVTDMWGLFHSVGQNTTNLTINLEKIDTSKVEDMGYMFVGAGQNSTTVTINTKNFDTRNTTFMNYMFKDVGQNSTTTTIDIKDFNTQNVTSMNAMFFRTGQTSETFTLDVSHFDTSNVTDMAFMFYNVGYSNPNFTLDVSNFDTSKVQDMGNMFYNVGYSNPNFTLDVSHFDTSQVTNMTNMFYNTAANSTKLNLKITISNPYVSTYSNMFYGIATKQNSIVTVNYTCSTANIIDQIINTKSPDSNVVKGSSSCYIGNEIIIAKEKFNVISQTNTTITMLAQYNLSTSYRQTTVENNLAFSTSNGWTYTPGPQEISLDWTSNPRNYISNYVTYLKNQTGDSTISGDLISLTQLKELNCVISDDYRYNAIETCENSNHASWLINGQSYWTKSALSTDPNYVFAVDANGMILKEGYSYNYYSYGRGIRPVITISK